MGSKPGSPAFASFCCRTRHSGSPPLTRRGCAGFQPAEYIWTQARDLSPLARGTTGGVAQSNEDPLPQKTRRSFFKASIPLEKEDKCRNSSPLLRQREAAATGHGGGGSNGCLKAKSAAGSQRLPPPQWRSATAIAPRPLSLRATSPQLRRGVFRQSSSFGTETSYHAQRLPASRIRRPTSLRVLTSISRSWPARFGPASSEKMLPCFTPSR